MKTLELASDVIAGASAFAAVIIVYTASTNTAFSTFSKVEQRTVATKLRRKAKISCVGVCFAAGAGALALIGKWASLKWMVATSACLMVLTLMWGVGIAVQMVREIK